LLQLQLPKWPVKIDAKTGRHGHWVIFQMAEVMVASDLFQKILATIATVCWLPPALC
jgi:hypothetical protein